MSSSSANIDHQTHVAHDVVRYGSQVIKKIRIARTGRVVRCFAVRTCLHTSRDDCKAKAAVKSQFPLDGNHDPLKWCT